jgi:hypothetical protein
MRRLQDVGSISAFLSAWEKISFVELERAQELVHTALTGDGPFGHCVGVRTGTECGEGMLQNEHTNGYTTADYIHCIG